MKPVRFRCALLLGTVLLAGCGAPPVSRWRVMRRSRRMTFWSSTLYMRKTARVVMVHEGRGGAAIALADPVYLAIVDDVTLRKVTANGVPGTAMPAFAQSAGGMLTDKQVDAIVKGIRTNWGKARRSRRSESAFVRGEGRWRCSRGALAYKNYCASCHGPDGRGGPKGSSITDSSFLALVSDQGLRTVVIAGRPELGAPDWRGNVPGKPMSEQEIGDVVAWLESQRVQNPGQPYPVSNPVSNSAQR